MNLFFSNWRRTLYLIFFLALLTRVAFILTQQDGFYFPDSLLYSQTAVKLLSAGEFGADFGLAPGYPVFLAAVYLVFGESIFVIRVVESVMGALLAVIMAQSEDVSGARLSEPWQVLSGPFILWVFLSPAWFIRRALRRCSWLAAFVVYCPLRDEELSAKGVFSGGLFFGLAALTIPVALLTIVVVAAWVFYWARHSRLFLASLLFLGSVVSVAPWTARNFLVHGRLSPGSSELRTTRSQNRTTSDGK